jgi:hypothetical protein
MTQRFPVAPNSRKPKLVGGLVAGLGAAAGVYFLSERRGRAATELKLIEDGRLKRKLVA